MVPFGIEPRRFEPAGRQLSAHTLDSAPGGIGKLEDVSVDPMENRERAVDKKVK